RRSESEGYLLAFVEHPAVSDVRDVLAVIDGDVPLPPDLLHLGRWLVDSYDCAAGWAFRAVGPPRAQRPAGTRRPAEAKADGIPSAAFPRPCRPPTAGEEATPPSLLVGDRRLAAYGEALAACLRAGRRAIVLSPEIASLELIIAQLTTVLNAPVGVIHAGLTARTRRLRWTSIARSEVDVVAGTRSAVFAPVPDLGLIIVDDEHDVSYKQLEVPRYHARDAAIERARMTGARVVLGSSTPSPEALRLCRETTTAAGDDPRPPVVAVDLRDELLAGTRGLLSRELRRQIEQVLGSRGRIVLLLNRLGYAGSILCRRCGTVARCDDCGVAFTLHAGDDDSLRCAQCAKRQARPEACPQCGSGDFRRLGGGTERLEAEVRAAFPGTGVDRLDSMVAPGRREQGAIERRFLRGDTAILVGTQLVAHVLPGAQLLGVVSIDAALHFPDFRAAERTFQLLDGMARRLGPTGRIVLQSFTPGHYALDCLVRSDRTAFYRQELAMRRQLRYPPFHRLARVVVTGSAAAARELAEAIRGIAAEDAEVLGPAPALQPLAGGRHRWSILLRGDESAPLAGILREAWTAWPRRRVDRVMVDIDPLDLT
ncbi:MAG TPA: primosomal protein N', partial [Phycisphaerae bacterium]|nr:primosomal protein N' [Phycisphaerae bacterium]